MSSMFKIADLLKKETKRNEGQYATLAAGGAMGIRAVENKYIHEKAKVRDFANFDELKGYYVNDVKPGDVIQMRDTFSRGATHPILVVDDAYYAWPDADGWKAGKRQIKVTDPDVISKKTRIPGYDYVAKGLVAEVGPNQKNPTEVLSFGSLEGKLSDLSHVDIPKLDASGKKYYERTFSATKARTVGGIYRQKDFDLNKFNETMNIAKENSEAGRYTYKGVSFDYKVAPNCSAKGNCVNFASSVLDSSKKNPTGKTHYLPWDFMKTLDEVKATKGITHGKSNFLTPVLVGEGLYRGYTGVKDDSARRVATGAGIIGAGIALNTNERVNNIVNNVGGFAAQSLGGMLVETPAKVMDAVTKKKFPGTDEGLYLEKARKFLDRKPGFSRGLGAAVIGVPAIYGLHKLMNRGQKKVEKL